MNSLSCDRRETRFHRPFAASADVLSGDYAHAGGVHNSMHAFLRPFAGETRQPGVEEKICNGRYRTPKAYLSTDAIYNLASSSRSLHKL